MTRDEMTQVTGKTITGGKTTVDVATCNEEIQCNITGCTTGM